MFHVVATAACLEFEMLWLTRKSPKSAEDIRFSSVAFGECGTLDNSCSFLLYIFLNYLFFHSVPRRIRRSHRSHWPSRTHFLSHWPKYCTASHATLCPRRTFYCSCQFPPAHHLFIFLSIHCCFSTCLGRTAVPVIVHSIDQLVPPSDCVFCCFTSP